MTGQFLHKYYHIRYLCEYTSPIYMEVNVSNHAASAIYASNLIRWISVLARSAGDDYECLIQAIGTLTRTP